MGCLKDDGDDSAHYLSGALGAWAQGLALQIAAGGVMFFTGYKWGGLEELKNLHKDFSISDGWKVMEVMGALHVVGSCIVAVLVLLAFFVSNCVTCVLTLVNSVNSFYCLAAAVACGYFLHGGYEAANNEYENIWSPEQYPPVDSSDRNYQLYMMARGPLLLGAVFSLSALAPFFRASTVKVSDSTSETVLYLTALILCLAAGATLVVPTNVFQLIIIGGIWIGCTIVIAALEYLLGCCSKRLAVGVLGVVFLCVAAYGLVTGALLGKWYHKGRELYFRDRPVPLEGRPSVQVIRDMDVDDRPYILMYEYTNEGSYLLAAIIMGFGQFIVALFCGAYSLRFVCGARGGREAEAGKQYY